MTTLPLLAKDNRLSAMAGRVNMRQHGFQLPTTAQAHRCLQSDNAGLAIKGQGLRAGVAGSEVIGNGAVQACTPANGAMLRANSGAARAAGASTTPETAMLNNKLAVNLRCLAAINPAAPWHTTSHFGPVLLAYLVLLTISLLFNVPPGTRCPLESTGDQLYFTGEPPYPLPESDPRTRLTQIFHPDIQCCATNLGNMLTFNQNRRLAAPEYATQVPLLVILAAASIFSLQTGQHARQFTLCRPLRLLRSVGIFGVGVKTPRRQLRRSRLN
jgi:hypothetical protein